MGLVKRHGPVLLTLLAACRGCDERTTSLDGASLGATPQPPRSDVGFAASVHSWPELPTRADEAATLIAASMRRDANAPGERDAGGAVDVVGRVVEAIENNEKGLTVGLTAISDLLDARSMEANGAGRSFVLLWGTHHDSAGQVETFRRLTGPTAKTHFTHVALEQLRADGRWAGIAPEVQRGDDDALHHWARTGSPDALREIANAQERDDYAAWKFGYVPSVLDVVADARSANHEVRGCDMPLPLQRRLGPARDTHGNALRELHCALALADVLDESLIPSSGSLPRMDGGSDPHRLAILWGGQHVGAGGFRRFLPKSSDVLSVTVFGGRPPSAPDLVVPLLSDRFDLVDPVLVRSAESPEDRTIDAIVVLADPKAADHFERKRVREARADAATAESRVSVVMTSSSPGTIGIDHSTVDVSPRAVSTSLSPGLHFLSAPRGKKRLVASFEAPRGGWVEIRLERGEPEITLTIHAPE